MDVDPAASMRCWAIEIELGGRTYEVPALPAADWWPILAEVRPDRILELIPSRFGPDADDLDGALLEGRIGGAELGGALTDAIEEVTGRSFHVAAVLATIANQHWPVIGAALASVGFRWDERPIGAALDLIYATIRDGLKDDEREKFDRMLEDESLTQPGKKRTPSQRVVKEFEAMAGPRPAPRPLPKKPPQSSAEPSDSAPPRTQTPRQPRRPAAPSSGPSSRP